MDNIIVLNIQKKQEEFAPAENIVIRRGDNQSDHRKFVILDGNDPLDLSDKTVLFMAYTNDGKLVADQATGTSFGEIDYTFPSFITSKSGKLRNAYFQIQKDSVVQSTNSLSITILNNVDTNDQQAAEWVPIINDIIAQRDSIVRESSDALTQMLSLANAVNTAEEARVTAETSRSTAEDSRIAAENSRSESEQARSTNEQARQNNEALRTAAEEIRQQKEQERNVAEQNRQTQEEKRSNEQQKNNADQAANNAAAQGITYQVLNNSEYALDSEGKHNVPSISGNNGKIYLTPNPRQESHNQYEQWLWLNNQWELAGDGAYVDPVTTQDIDSIVNRQQQVQGERYLNLTGLSYYSNINSTYIKTQIAQSIQSVINSIFPVGSYIIRSNFDGVTYDPAVTKYVSDPILGTWQSLENIDIPLWLKVDGSNTESTPVQPGRTEAI